ncbi:MAG: glycosyl hydrolase [Limisphaerales bacterium]
MKTTFTRRQLLKFLTAAGVGAPFTGPRAAAPYLTAPNAETKADGALRGAVPGVVPGVTSALQAKEKVLAYLKGLSQGSYLFGQVATWVHNENPDMDHPSNWIQKLREHTGRLPRYGCITYDFVDDPFPDAAWNEGVQKLWNRGMIAGVYSFFANPSGGEWNDPCEIEKIWAPGDNAVKTHFHRQLDRMAANLQWLKDRGIPVIYTPFVESDDRNKWHAKQGSEAIIRLYRLVHDYFNTTKQLDHILWAYHTTQNSGALERCYPGDVYVDVLGKSAYGSGLVFAEYEWAVAKKKDHGKVIWWAELGIRGKSEPPRDCQDVLRKLESHFPELAGFVFWSDEGFYNVVGNRNAREFMDHPKIVARQGRS